jgi:hypothetical protein
MLCCNGCGQADDQFDFLVFRLPAFADVPSHFGCVAPCLIDRRVQRLRNEIGIPLEDVPERCFWISGSVSRHTFECRDRVLHGTGEIRFWATGEIG